MTAASSRRSCASGSAAWPGSTTMVLSLSAKGLTTGRSRLIWPRCTAQVSRKTISTITDKVMDELAEWQNRPLDRVYPVLFIDAINVKIRDGQVANRPIYVVMAVTVDGHRDILGIWAGDGGEGAKYWLQVFTELKNRGVDDVCMSSATGSRACPRRSRRPGRGDRPDLCGAPAAEHVPSRRPPGLGQDRQGSTRLHRARRGRRRSGSEFQETWGDQVSGDREAVDRTPGPSSCPSSPSTSRSARSSAPRTRSRRQRPHPQGRPRPRTLPQRGRRPQVHLHGADEPGPDRQGPQRWTMRWKAPLNAFQIAFPGRIVPSSTY